MALQDIITAIIEEADREIAILRENHERSAKMMRHAHQQSQSMLKNNMSEQLETRKKQLLLKVHTHCAVERRNRISAMKQEVINAAFTEALTMLAALPDEKVEGILRACLKHIKGKGSLLVSKRHEALLRKIAPSEQFTIENTSDAMGGFRFISTAAEADYTFEQLIHGVLRPMKELEIAHLLFLPTA